MSIVANPNHLRVRHANSLEEARAAELLSEEEAKTGQSSVTFVNYEMSQDRVTALMNRFARIAGQVNGTQAAEEVRKIMGNAMAEEFGNAGSDDEGNSSEEERDHQNRIGRNGGRGDGGGRGGRKGGRGDGGGGGGRG